MKKNLDRTIEIPEGVTISINRDEVKVSGSGKENVRKFAFGKIVSKQEGSALTLSAKKATRRESRILGTIEGHIKNMIKGLNEEFVYKLEVCNVHFPMTVKLEGNKVRIKSFLGEKVDRIANVDADSKVEIKGSKITVTSHKIESAGTTATNIEKAARLTGRDRRIFQDGIFLTEKNGRVI